MSSSRRTADSASTTSSRNSVKPTLKKRSKPYDHSQRPNAQRFRASDSTHSSTSQTLDMLVSTGQPSRSKPPPYNLNTTNSSSSSTIHSAGIQGTRRESYLEFLRDKHPTFEPKNDYEILTVVGSNYRGPESGLRAWLDSYLNIDLMATVGLRDLDAVAQMDPAKAARITERLIERARSILDQPGSITGMKPKPSTPNVFCRPVPNSSYSVRLFPGSIAQREYCLDFVDTATGNPVNSPPGFEVWSVRGGSTGMGDAAAARVHSLEHTLGFRGASLKPGAEKFVLRDGQTCLLKRPGHRDVQFKVPTRTDGLNLQQPDVDHLEFPELV